MNPYTIHNVFSTVSALPLWVVIIPLIGAFIVLGAAVYSEKMRDYLAIIITAVTFILSAVLYWAVLPGTVGYRLDTGFLESPLLFRVDLFGATFNLLSSFIWLLAVIFSLTYMQHEKHRTRYHVFMLLTLSGCLGVFLTGDFVSLFIFFELMSLASYLLVIHVQTPEAMKAGRLYLYLSIFGGLCLLTGIFLLFHLVGTVEIAPLLEKMAVLPERYLILALLITGFGIKAGMVPLHIWLPQAHPVAPSPASALLSGIMIKTGAYGIIRVVNVFNTPGAAGSSSLWETTAGGPGQLGWIIIWMGIATMFIAAFIALFQTNAKRILAYSSVSQMGYILMGIGTAAYLGYSGAMGFAGFTFHILNHAFFKAGLFMMIGAVYARTHRLDITRLGGLWREFPVTTVAFLIAAAGLAGVPGFNGYASKTLLHHALLEAFEHNHHLALLWAERIFILTSGFTVCYIAKVFTSVFLGRKPADLPAVAGEPWSERLVFALFGGIILFTGLFPAWTLNKWILPLAGSFPYDPQGVNHLAGLSVWGGHDLKAIFGVLGIGAVFFLLFKYSSLSTFRLPERLDLETLVYKPVINAAMFIYTGAGQLLETAIDRTIVDGPEQLRYLCLQAGALDRGAIPLWGHRLSFLLALLIKNIHYYWIRLLTLLFGQMKKVVRVTLRLFVRLDYDPDGNRLFQALNISNFNFGLFVLMLLLLIFLVKC